MHVLEEVRSEALGRVLRIPCEDRGAQNCCNNEAGSSQAVAHRLSREVILVYNEARGQL